MLDDPEIQEQIRRMRPTFERIIWRVRNRWSFRLEECDQVIWLALSEFLEILARAGEDPVAVLRKMSRNALSTDAHILFWQLVTRVCREQYDADRRYDDSNPKTQRNRRRRIPATVSLPEQHVQAGEIGPFDVRLVLNELIASLPIDLQEIAYLLMYSETISQRQFRREHNLTFHQFKKRVEETKARLAEAIRLWHQEAISPGRSTTDAATEGEVGPADELTTA